MILKATFPLLAPLFPVSSVPDDAARLCRAARRGGPLALGTPEAPYEPAGRSPLVALEGFEGLEITVVTRSPEITGEIGLLAELDRRCSVTVEMLVPAADPVLAWKLEAVARLAAEGIAVRVLCPPGAGEVALRKLLGTAREAGAWDVRALTPPRSRLTLRQQPDTANAADITFQRLRLEYGFPREMTGRG